MIKKAILVQGYVVRHMSMQEIADELGCSLHKVAYYMHKYGISSRTRSEAIYQKHHPAGDPFRVKTVSTTEDARLLGMGVGLYWGEGTKASKHSIRLGNTDPELLKTFILFLVKLFGVDQEDLRFGLQLFSDINADEALLFWTQKLGVKTSQFYKTTVTISGSIGTYRKKSKYGVVTMYYHNKKLRDILVGMLPR